MATTYTWTHVGPGDWADAANWSPAGGPPKIADTAITAAGNVTLTGTGVAGTLKATAITASSTTTVTGHVSIANDVLLDLTTLKVAGGTIDVGGTLFGGVVGSLFTTNGTLDVTLGGVVHAGAIVMRYWNFASPIATNYSVINVSSDSILEIGTAGTGQPGTLTIDPGALYSGSGSRVTAHAILNDGTINVPGGTWIGDLTNNGTMIGGSAISPSTMNVNNGTMIAVALANGINNGTLIEGSVSHVTNTGTLIGTSISDLTNSGVVIVGERMRIGANILGLNTLTFNGPGVATFQSGIRPTLSGLGINTSINMAGIVVASTIVSSGTASGDLVLTFDTGATTTFHLIDHTAATLYLFQSFNAASPNVTTTVTGLGPNPGPGTTPPTTDTGPASVEWVSKTGGDWNDPANWLDSKADSVVPGIKSFAAIRGDGGLISGQGRVGHLTVEGLAVFGGHVSAGSFGIGPLRTGGDRPGATVVMLRDSRVTTGSATLPGGILRNEGGTLSVAGLLSVGQGARFPGDSAVPGQIITSDGGITRSGTLTLFAGARVDLDATSFLEVGNAGTAAAGTLTVDTGASLIGEGTIVASAVLNNGTISGKFVFQRTGSPINNGLYKAATVIDVVNNGTILATTVNNIMGNGKIIASALTNVTGDADIQFGVNQFVNFGTNVSGHVTFAPGPAILITPSTIGNLTLKSFADDDELVLQGLTATSVAYSATGPLTGQLILSNGITPVATLAVDGDFTGHTFLVTMPDFDPGSAYLTLDNLPSIPACFLAGTRIQTRRGPVAVEDLQVGDAVATLLPPGFRPIRWLGHRHVDPATHPTPRDVLPVRIRAGAFADDVPVRDLFLSPDHAVCAEGGLIPVRHLLNGTSIAQVPATEVTYWHVELDRHDVLLAEGLAAESYLDTGDRSSFANAGTVVSLHPTFTALTWDAQGCGPLLVTGAALDRLRTNLAERAKAEADGQAGGAKHGITRGQRHPRERASV